MIVGVTLTSGADDVWDQIENLLRLGKRERHKVAEAVRLGIAWNFAHESAGGKAWAPLAEMTVGIRRAEGYAGRHPILQRSGRLKLSLTDVHHPMNLFIEDVDQGEIKMEFGSLDPHFPLLHKGGYIDGGDAGQQPSLPGMDAGPLSTGGRYVPARPMTVLGTEAIDRLRETITYVLRERWGRLPHQM